MNRTSSPTRSDPVAGVILEKTTSGVEKNISARTAGLKTAKGGADNTISRRNLEDMALMTHAGDDLLTELRRKVTALENRIKNLRAMHQNVVEGRGTILSPNFKSKSEDRKAA